jgi:hypothetical protein
VIEWMGPANVCVAEAGPSRSTISVSLAPAAWGSAKSPTIETRAISAGKIASRP